MNFQEYERAKKVDHLLEKYGLELHGSMESPEFISVRQSYKTWPHKKSGEHSPAPQEIFKGKLSAVENFINGIGFLEKLLLEMDMIPEDFIAKALESSQQKHLIGILSRDELEIKQDPKSKNNNQAKLKIRPGRKHRVQTDGPRTWSDFAKAWTDESNEPNEPSKYDDCDKRPPFNPLSD